MSKECSGVLSILNKLCSRCVSKCNSNKKCRIQRLMQTCETACRAMGFHTCITLLQLKSSWMKQTRKFHFHAQGIKESLWLDYYQRNKPNILWKFVSENWLTHILSPFNVCRRQKSRNSQEKEDTKQCSPLTRHIMSSGGMFLLQSSEPFRWY